MKSNAISIIASIFLAAVGIHDLHGEDLVIKREAGGKTFLAEHLGETYLQTFLRSGIGMDAKLDADFQRTITIVSPEAVLATMATFDPKVSERAYRNFRNGRAAFEQAIGGISGKTIAIKDLRDLVKPLTDPLADSVDHQGLALSVVATMAELCSGAGTVIILDENNYFYNVGYQDNVSSSGRSYGVAKGRLLLDATDNDYLSELTSYLGPESDPTAFYRAILELLTATDVRAMSGLDDTGQAVATDFMTVYTAELERNNMAGLSPTKWAWQTDLAEVTLLSAYGGASGMVMQQGQLVTGPANAYYTSGGIGNTRPEFTRLGRWITSYMKKQHPELIFKLLALTPIANADVLDAVDGDIFRRVLVFLNRTETQVVAASEAQDLTNSVLQLLAASRVEQASITNFVQASLP